MSRVVPSPLADLIVWLADNKYLLGRRYAEWANRAPALEAAVAAAAMTQDELGHARSLYAVLHSLPNAPEAYLQEEKRQPLLADPALHRPFGQWAELVAAAALFDRAVTMVFEAARDSSYEPLRQRAGKILQEEWFHRQYGEGWLTRMAAQPGTRSAMQAAVNRMWQPTANWLGAGPDGGLAADRVLADSALDRRGRWTSEMTSLLRRSGLDVPND